MQQEHCSARHTRRSTTRKWSTTGSTSLFRSTSRTTCCSSRPLPPMSSAGPPAQSSTAQNCPRIWQPLGSRPKCPPSNSPSGYAGGGVGSGGDGATNPESGEDPSSGGVPPQGPPKSTEKQLEIDSLGGWVGGGGGTSQQGGL